MTCRALRALTHALQNQSLSGPKSGPRRGLSTWMAVVVACSILNSACGARVPAEATAAGGASSSALPPGTQNPDAKLSGVLVLSSARKRAFRRAQNRATRAGATFYRGKWVTSHQLQAAAGELRSSHCRARTTSKPLATLGNLAAWPPGPKSRASTFRRAPGLLNVLSVNIEGFSAELYDEFCIWLEMPEVPIASLDVIFVRNMA